MSDLQNNNKRIAKNTVVLYLRMFFSLVIQLFTSRLVLQALGVEDYGIYNVVGGVVTTLSFINMSLSNANSRFISVELGAGRVDRLKRLFSCIITIHYIFAIIVLLLAETVGLWFVLNKLVIPAERMTAAIVVYQCSVISSIITIISSPYNGLIIAHERMSAFAIISILSTVSNFLIALLLFISPIDRLIAYSILHVIVQLIIRIIYIVYSRNNFPESKYILCWDNKISKNVLSFAGWTLTGNLSVIGYTQGLNILLNIFFGAIVNAARGISTQVQNAVRMFSSSFQTAINPQIMKSYASGEYNRMQNLIITSSRLSFYLMLIVSLPLCMHTEYILELWLADVPEHSVIFVQIILAVSLIHTLQNPTMTAIHATGCIKNVQIIESILLLSVVPIAYVCLKYFHCPPETVYIVYFIIEFITQFVRVFMIYPKVKIPISNYFLKVFFPISLVTSLALLVALSYAQYVKVNSILSLLYSVIFYIISTAIIAYIFGLSNAEKKYIKSYIIKILRRS